MLNQLTADSVWYMADPLWAQCKPTDKTECTNDPSKNSMDLYVMVHCLLLDYERVIGA